MATPFRKPDYLRQGSPVWQVRTAHCDSRLNIEVTVVDDPDNGPLLVLEHGPEAIVLDDVEEFVAVVRLAEFARSQRAAALAGCSCARLCEGCGEPVHGCTCSGTGNQVVS